MPELCINTQKSIGSIELRVIGHGWGFDIERILVSSCLLGQPVRYNGTDKPNEHADVLTRWAREERLIPFCPEVAVGFPTPRPPAEIVGNTQSSHIRSQGKDVLSGDARVLEKSGADVTHLYLKAADKTVALARQHGCSHAVLTDGSPSCGSSFIYDGTFSGTGVPGMGTTATALCNAGIHVWSQAQIAKLDAMLRTSA
ncbi:DUF523 domain-containing protein [Ruegeria sp. ANG-R]|uniref:DUF523 domain-containing protein n=1 Tax=Ruegeria sp. ANG-R TaxID=1577903 RepID=UPI0019D33345|nr:DUF523 domain-containing protein [Ruegeria sp. ANG-R]